MRRLVLDKELSSSSPRVVPFVSCRFDGQPFAIGIVSRAAGKRGAHGQSARTAVCACERTQSKRRVN